MGDLERLSLNTTTAFLAGVAVVQLAATLRAGTGDGAYANALGTAVCVVAFLHYQWMRNAAPAEQVRLRYGDWLVTVVLLQMELQRATGVRGQRWTWGAVALMVALGYGAVRTRHGGVKWSLFAASSACLAATAAATVRGATRERPLAIAFYSLWAAYPLAFVLDNNNTLFNILDFASKGAFGLYVAAKAVDA